MKYLLFVFITTLHLYSLDFKVASYNVENFFDLHYDKTEYKEYIPYTKYWNKTSYTNKLTNVSKVIKDLDADILALQEIESESVMDAIIQKNPQYKYFRFLKNKNAAIGVSLLSKFPILNSENIIIDKYDKYARDILKVTLNIQKKPFIIYVNHWRSKRAKESQRIKYALALQKEINTLKSNEDYIILGDLNSNYNEYQTFKYDKRLNDTFNITGINQILNTTIDENLVRKNSILTYNQKVHYNTWLDLPIQNRFSTLFRTDNNTPDHILLSQALFDDKKIYYLDNSFMVFKKPYLYENNKIIRWNKYKNTGYSDHLPIYAYFSTNKQKYDFKTKLENSSTNTIDHLYTIEQISNYRLKDVTVIYKAPNLAIVKQTNNHKAIMIYKPPAQLELGYKYDFTVDKLDLYFGLKEIKSISSIVKKEKNKNFTHLFLDGNKTDLNNYQLLNNIVYNIQGIYKNNYLYFPNSITKKIKLYFPKGIKKPEDGDFISISSGHLSVYRSSIQIVLHKKKDFKTF
jgi:hypothetical protein